ncbi:GNAT family N-acetyltransferase [Clostridia bacterium OttesenSCG-928-F22]|nr:GNAT family N-acetyltransferase [Clostridia bacterium OttesenSCG-928-F22]
MEFRQATTHDVPALTALRKQQLIDEGLPVLQNIDNELRDFFLSGLSDKTFISWVALENGSIIATSGLSFYKLPPTYANPSGIVAYINNMFTLKEHRRKGIAAVLFEKVLSEVRSAGCSLVRLHASSDGRALYAKFGFLPTDGYMALYL